MIGLVLRGVLILGSLLTLILMLTQIRKAKIQIRDSIFWILFSIALFILSVLPELAEWASRVLGIMAPINFVFLFIIFILIFKQFYTSIRLSRLDTRTKELAQQLALYKKENEDLKKKNSNTTNK